MASSNPGSITLNNWYPPSKAQQTYITNYANRNYFWAGRGSGKTASIVAKAVITSIVVNPGCTGYIVESTYNDIRDILLPMWESMVPSELYSYHSTDKIVTFVNGSKIKFASAETKGGRRNADLFRGPNISWMIIDEARKIKDMTIYLQATAMLRERKARVRFLDLVSTAEIGWMHTLAEKYGVDDWTKPFHKVKKDNMTVTAVYTNTGTNKYNFGLMDQLKAEYDEKFFQQEALSAWVSLSGLVYDNFSGAQYPLGNVIDFEYNPKKDIYLLAMDIGSANNSMVLFSPIILDGIQRWVAFDEYHGVGGVDQILSRISAKYNKQPDTVYIGHDGAKRDSGSGYDSRYFIRQHFGAGVPTIALSGPKISPAYRYSRMRHAICDVNHDRRLLISQKLWNKTQDESDRGVKQMFTRYSFPDNAYRNACVMPKDHKYEHCNDAISHIIAYINTPFQNPTDPT